MERKYPDSDRFQYQTNYQKGTKTFVAGAVVRANYAKMLPLIQQGVVREVPAYTLCRINPLAAGGCSPVQNIEALEVPQSETFEKEADDEGRPEIKQAGTKAGKRKHNKK